MTAPIIKWDYNRENYLSLSDVESSIFIPKDEFLNKFSTLEKGIYAVICEEEVKYLRLI